MTETPPAATVTEPSWRAPSSAPVPVTPSTVTGSSPWLIRKTWPAAPYQLQGVGQVARPGHARAVEHLAQQLAQAGDGGGGEIPGGAGAQVVAGDGGVPGVGAAGEALDGPRARQVDPLGPDPALGGGGRRPSRARAAGGTPRSDRPSSVAQRAGVAAGVDRVVLVDDAGEVRHQQRARPPRRTGAGSWRRPSRQQVRRSARRPAGSAERSASGWTKSTVTCSRHSAS